MKRGSALKRSAITRKPPKPKKRPANPCAWSSRCKARPRIEVTAEERYCLSHGCKVADIAVGSWVKHVRDRVCLFCGTDRDLEWAHIRSRGAHRSLRWHVGLSRYTGSSTWTDPGNSIALCRGHHFMFTRAPARWDKWVEMNWPGLYTRLVHLEIENEGKRVEPDIGQIIREFRARLAEAA